MRSANLRARDREDAGAATTVRTADSGHGEPGESDPGMPVTLGKLDHILGLHIGLANLAIVRHFNATIAELELSQKQVSILWLVRDHPGSTQAELARALCIHRSNIRTISKELLARKLIQRTSLPGDGRKLGLSTTAEGEAVLDEAIRRVSEHERHFWEVVGADRARDCIETLRMIHETGLSDD